MAATLVAVACLASAIYPRSRAHPAQRLTPIAYFGDVVALDSPSQLRELLGESDTQLADVWIDQVWQTSAIVSRKYQLVRWSVRMLGAALSLAVVIVIEATVGSH